MKYSKLFPKTLKQTPTGADSLNLQFLTRAGFIHQEMAGVYTYLLLGWRVLNKISDIVREEMNAIGGQEVIMPVLQPADSWKKTGRYTSMDVLFKLKGASEADLILGPTHEEIVYPLVAENIESYKDLPIYLYQIQVKFRNEPRAKAGLLRGREFLMKDLYSFHVSDEDRDNYYEKARKAYLEIFKKIGLPVIETKAGGGTFSSISQEFQVLTPSGEDTIFICKDCSYAINRELVDSKKCPECGGSLEEKKAIEVGNIFPLKRAFAEVFNLSFIAADGQKTIVSAGCYGLGISRTMGAIVEVFHDDKGIIWPESVAPFLVHIVGLDMEGPLTRSARSGQVSAREKAEHIYNLLQAESVEVLFDDRTDVSAGEKFADADLIGIPYRIVVSKKTGDKLEIKKRSEKETRFLILEELIKMLKD